ncbi:MAG: hypothetical protein ACFCVC_00775 [Acidimicrobiia bacterium]
MDTALSETVTITGDRVVIEHVAIADSVLADLLRRCPVDEQGRLLERVLSVGARGLATMGIGIDIAEVDNRVHRTVERVTEEAALRAQAMLDEAGRVMASSLDPDQRSSLIARAVADFGSWRDSFLSQVDPDAAHSHTGRLLVHLNGLLGPGGTFEQRLATALDPTTDGSGLAKVSDLIERRFSELREMVAEDRGRRQEADRGTAKGFDYEDVIEERLRHIARPLGALVERTSTLGGSLAGDAIVGDFVVEMAEGGRIVVEAKNTRSLSLTGRDGILAQLDRAIDNRDARMAVCVSATDAFPAEVGVFGVYGNRILVVDDGDGTMLGVALRWARLSLAGARINHPDVDLGAIDERLDRIRMLAQRFSTSRRALTDIAGSVEKVRDGLDEMRRELLEFVDDATSEVRRSRTPVEVVELTLQAG